MLAFPTDLKGYTDGCYYTEQEALKTSKPPVSQVTSRAVQFLTDPHALADPIVGIALRRNMSLRVTANPVCERTISS